MFFFVDLWIWVVINPVNFLKPFTPFRPGILPVKKGGLKHDIIDHCVLDFAVKK
jgi:hypothetical protein